MGPPLVTRQVSNLLVVHFIGRLSLETKPRPRSWPTLSIVWRQLNDENNVMFTRTHDTTSNHHIKAFHNVMESYTKRQISVHFAGNVGVIHTGMHQMANSDQTS